MPSASATSASAPVSSPARPSSRCVEDRVDRFPARAGRDGQAQCRERIERMRGREAQRDGLALGLPLHEAIGEFALAAISAGPSWPWCASTAPNTIGIGVIAIRSRSSWMRPSCRYANGEMKSKYQSACIMPGSHSRGRNDWRNGPAVIFRPERKDPRLTPLLHGDVNAALVDTGSNASTAIDLVARVARLVQQVVLGLRDHAGRERRDRRACSPARDRACRRAPRRAAWSRPESRARPCRARLRARRGRARPAAARRCRRSASARASRSSRMSRATSLPSRSDGGRKRAPSGKIASFSRTRGPAHRQVVEHADAALPARDRGRARRSSARARSSTRSSARRDSA